MLPTTAGAKQSWTLAATVAERCTRTQLWTTEMFYKRRPTAPSSRQNAVSRNSCRCCFWDKDKFQYVFDQLEPKNKQHQAVKGRFVSYPQEYVVIGFDSSCYELWYSTGESAPAGILVFVRFCWNRINGQRGMVRRRAEWVSKLSSVNMFCFDSMVCTVIKWCSSEADVNICLLD